MSKKQLWKNNGAQKSNQVASPVNKAVCVNLRIGICEIQVRYFVFILVYQQYVHITCTFVKTQMVFTFVNMHVHSQYKFYQSRNLEVFR